MKTIKLLLFLFTSYYEHTFYTNDHLVWNFHNAHKEETLCRLKGFYYISFICNFDSIEILILL
jgi:hypothetical protein